MLSADYYGKGKETTPEPSPSTTPVTTRAISSSTKDLTVSTSQISTHFRPYWMHNLTGIPLEYYVEEEPQMEDTLEVYKLGEKLHLRSKQNSNTKT